MAKIALAQFRSAIGKVEPNKEKMIGMIRKAASEGADIIMVKPALPYLDVLRRAKERFGGVPTSVDRPPILAA